MAVKKRKKNKFGITPSVILLNLTVVLLICIICFFTYNVIMGDGNEQSSAPPFTPVTSETEQVSSQAQSEPSSVETTPDPTVSSDTTVSTEDSLSTPQETSESEPVESDSESDVESDAPVNNTSYDKSYFETTLFVGDSISTGLSLYGFIDEDNVFAVQGMAPSTALSTEINSLTLEDKVAAFKPERIVIMLGTNSIGYADTSYLVESMDTLVSTLSQITTAEIVVLSIPPITANAEARDDNYLTLSVIKDYNDSLRQVAADYGVEFVDLFTALTDSTGYFHQDYAENDGIHFMGATYQVMLSMIQNHTSE